MMVDFHCHILPKMDDGSDSINTSLAMLRAEHTSCGSDPAFLLRRGIDRSVLTATQKGFFRLTNRYFRPTAYRRYSRALLRGRGCHVQCIGTDGLTTALHCRNKCLAETTFKLYLPILSGFPVYGIKKPLQQSWNCPSTNKSTVPLFVKPTGDGGGNFSAG